jgi:hypothetical protein
VPSPARTAPPNDALLLSWTTMSSAHGPGCGPFAPPPALARAPGQHLCPQGRLPRQPQARATPVAGRGPPGTLPQEKAPSAWYRRRPRRVECRRRHRAGSGCAEPVGRYGASAARRGPGPRAPLVVSLGLPLPGEGQDLSESAAELAHPVTLRKPLVLPRVSQERAVQRG